MLTGYPEQQTIKPEGELPTDLIWLDLLNPTPDELSWAEGAVAHGLPQNRESQRIRVSNRSDGDKLHLNISAFTRAQDGHSASPLSLLLTPSHVVSVRFEDSDVFRAALASASKRGLQSSCGMLVAFLDHIVEESTAEMQRVSEELNELSHRTFCQESLRTGYLRDVLMQVGHLERRLSQTESQLLGIERLVAFVLDSKREWVGDSENNRLKDLQRDLKALDEFDAQLDNKVQFMLDAALGFISTNQNDVFRYMTVVTVVTIPPMILAGIWGMNFKFMPELNWPYGYPVALLVIVLSMLIPLAYFKKKGWA